METLEKIADDIINEYGNESTTTRPDILALVRQKGFLVGNVDMDDADGFLIVNDKEIVAGFSSNKIIGVNSKKDLKSKRFIIAQEFSFYELLKRRNPGESLKIARRDSFRRRNKEERLVDYVAANLLMPTKLFTAQKKELEKKGKAERKIIVNLSDYYDVPVKIAKQRMDQIKKAKKEGNRHV